MTRKLTQQEFEEKARIVHQDSYGYDLAKYVGYRVKIDIFCNLCKTYFSQQASAHLMGQGCSDCITGKRIKTDSEFASDAQNVHGDLYDYTNCNYNGALLKVNIKCNRCTKNFTQQASAHLSGQGCPYCSKRSVSKKELEWLNSIGLPNDNIHRQVKLKVPSKTKSISVDGFDPNTNTVYEFYGDWYHGNPKIYHENEINPLIKKTYGELFRTTIRRELIIQSAGYSLITIWENQWDKIKRESRKIADQSKQCSMSIEQWIIK